ncbi:MAG TPA: Glu-tRNA(Gln) amidotransferase subunit GatD [Methanobacteriaceae archaeon]|jgi:glutamyl-tRNA(Gln) amidotransferase subunit D|nr:Glu-tRNA(Gln) amidotransferase subunit GatD [Methanobacteriaceae archaeon]
MNYQGLARKFLESQDINIGDRILIKKRDLEYQGMLLDRAEDADDQHIVIKLDNGYNIGINISETSLELLERGDAPKIEFAPLEFQKDPEKMDISIISTGGTVASIIDYKTGAVHPAFTAEDLLRATPELLDEANIKGKAIMNILSENMQPDYWVETARSIADEINQGAQGVVVAHGTDTMHYTSAALSFILETPVPVILTGAQRSSDRPSSDAFLNLMNSVTAARSDLSEVMVCMHANENDNYAYLHRGTKVRKMHTSRRDTFQSVNSSPLARIQEGRVKVMDQYYSYKKRGEYKLEVNDSLEPKIALIKIFPGVSGDLVDYHIDKGYQGLVLEGTGLGHCPEDVMPSLHRAADEEIPVVMTSQCLYGRTNLNVYSSGRQLLKAGVIPSGDMLPETAYVKLMWAMGQTRDRDGVKRIMESNLRGELSDKSSSQHFLKDYGE